MGKTAIIHLDSQADERSFRDWEIRTLKLGGSYELRGSFAVYHDRKEHVDKYLADHRILQIDELLDRDEQLKATKEFGNSNPCVVWFHKVRYDHDDDAVLPPIKNIGHKPFGFECVLASVNPSWTVVFTPSFSSRIVIPSKKIFGIDEKIGDGDE